MSDALFRADSEIALISILLNHPQSIFEINRLRSFMFSSNSYREIFQVIDDLAKQRITPDFHLIENSLQSTKKLEFIGGRDYLDYIRSQEFSNTNIAEYEDLIIKAWKARSVISIASSMERPVDINDIDNIITEYKAALDKLTVESGGDSTVTIADIVDETLNEIIIRTENPGVRGKTTGFQNIDLVTSGYNAGDLWIIAGRPGAGKTALLCNSVLNGAKSGVKSLIFELEMSKQQLIERFISIETKIDLTNIRMGLLDKGNIEKIKLCIERFKELPIYIDTNYITNLNYVETTIRRFKKFYDIDISYLDNINLLVERTSDSTNELGRASRRFKLLANELNITNIVISQLNRGVESRDDKRPKLSDLRQSGNLEEDADIVIGLYRDSYYNKSSDKKDLMEALILKQRNGPTGMIPLGFIDSTNHIFDK